MKKQGSFKNPILLGLLLILGGFLLFGGFHASSKTANQTTQIITVYLAGDSTVSDYPKNRAPESGWGQAIGVMFDENVMVKNEAASGRSAKSFITEGRLAKILKEIHRGDYLFIQFGHNDQKINDPNRSTEPFTTYKSYLKQYIDGAREKGAIPVLVTPVERRKFSVDGKAIDTHGHYPEAMKELGKEEHVVVIDLTTKSKQLFERLGQEKTKDIFLFLDAGENPNFPNGVMDNTHFQEKGAREMARLVLDGIEEQNIPLRLHIKDSRKME